jgi:hypothetical protein
MVAGWAAPILTTLHLSPGLGVFFSRPLSSGEEGLARLSHPRDIFISSPCFAWLIESFLLQGWVHGGPLCTVKNVSRKQIKKRPVFLVDLATLSLVHDILKQDCFRFCINAYASEIIDAPRLSSGIENTYIQECGSFTEISSLGTDRRWRSL